MKEKIKKPEIPWASVLKKDNFSCPNFVKDSQIKIQPVVKEKKSKEGQIFFDMSKLLASELGLGGKE